MAQIDAPILQPDLTNLDLGDAHDLRVIEGEDRYSIWAFGRMRKLFFITGHPRSGTTWAAAVLMRHPRVFCDGEFHFHQLRSGFDAIQRQPWHRVSRDPVHTTAESCFQDTVRLCMGACANKKPDAEWIGSRTPRRLQVLLPGAPHVVIVRDGRDVTVSMAIMEMNSGSGAFTEAAADPSLQHARAEFLKDPNFFKNNPDQLLACEPFVRSIARRWGDLVRHDLEVAKRIRAGDLSATVHFVSYERLHADPEAERSAMYQFLGLEPGEAEPLTEDSRTTPGLGQDNHRSDKRKGVVGDWANYFTEQSKQWFKDEANDALVAMGYESDDRW